MNTPTPSHTAPHVVILTGMAGAGKSVALRGLEDAGFFCVDNLPPELLQEFVKLQGQHGVQRIAIAIDARSVRSLPKLSGVLQALQAQGVQVQQIFLDASDEVLKLRFSETRRRHPLSGDSRFVGDMGVANAIAQERELLQDIREQSQVQLVDTSHLRAAQLLTHIKTLVGQSIDSHLSVVLQSFAFKKGLPLDANFVVDARMLPNPFYEDGLRVLTGQDAPVQAFLSQQPSVREMEEMVLEFLHKWLPAMAQEHRSYVNIAIGCTGGQHRSVYLVERIYQALAENWAVTKRHRELAE